MSLESIEAQIQALQQKAAAIKSAEVEGVIGRIKVAIAHYGLTAQDLGLSASHGRKVAVRSSGVAEKSKVASATGKRRVVKVKAKSASVAKYTDGQGNSWSGHGKRPNWFKAALEAGKKPEELLVQQGDAHESLPS
ncbi:H-NS family nucleoid-associated regulatory protein [Pseudorhodoferax soli]|nr:H-NS histone family protein [Pseudorhodoferax soli]